MLSKVLEEAKFYGLWELIDELVPTQLKVTALTHIHCLNLVPVEENYVCRGLSLFSNPVDISNCYNTTNEVTRWMFECKTCKEKNITIRYCLTCANKQEKNFKNQNHAHELIIDKIKSDDWNCYGKFGKDGCKSDNKTLGILRFKCSQCEYNYCEYCLEHYHQLSIFKS